MHLCARAVVSARGWARFPHKRVTPSEPCEQHCYTDASVKRRCAGLGIVWEDKHRRVAARLRAPESDINVSEMLAILFGILFSRPHARLVLHTDSQVSLDHIACPSDTFYGLGRAILCACAARAAETHFVKVKAHAGVAGNERADALAKRATDDDGAPMLRPFPLVRRGAERAALTWYLRACGMDPADTVLGTTPALESAAHGIDESGGGEA